MAESQLDKGELTFQRKIYPSECDLDQLIIGMDKFEHNKFIYLNYAVPTSSVHFTPYNLKVVSYDEMDKRNFITMSPRGVTVWQDSESCFTKLPEWCKEYELYKSLIKVRFMPGSLYIVVSILILALSFSS